MLKNYNIIMIFKKENKNNKPEKKFRIRSKKLFLTYSNINWKKSYQELREYSLKNYEKIFGLNRSQFLYTIVVEKHAETESVHIHTYLEFGITQSIYSQTKLNIDFEDGNKVKHPNISSGKDKQNRIEYMLKDIASIDDVLTNDNLQIVEGNFYRNAKEYLANILPIMGLERTLDILHTHHKKLCVTSGIQVELQLRNMWERILIKKDLNKKPDYLLEDFNEKLPEVKLMIEWFQEAIQNKHSTTLLISGPADTGKTKIIIALANKFKLPLIFISHPEDLKNFDSNSHKLMLLDDISPKSFHNREQLIAVLDVENDRSIRVLYTSVKIPSKTIKVITTNKPNEWTNWNDKPDQALIRRTHSIEVNKPLFKKKSIKSEEKLLIPETFSNKDD